MRLQPRAFNFKFRITHFELNRSMLLRLLLILTVLTGPLPLAAQTGGRAQAIALIESFEKDPANWPKVQLMDVAVAYANVGDFDAALPIFQEIVRTDPKNGRALRGIATINLFKKNIPAAIEYFQKAIAAGDDQAPKGLAGIYCAQGAFDKIKPLLPKLLELKKDNVDCSILLAAYAVNVEPRDKALFDQATEDLSAGAIVQSGDANARIMADAYKAFGYDDKAAAVQAAMALKTP
jgi:tetratricopeptide (TPR) repeat protein